ncbi:DUF1800 family protein [Asticcacaulis sp. AND118]|uniref:DUF1800 domain-containing protein n=1 Tax=Asticcacaulis sp. AND118 TaxID=2840468 RepID=UPI001CFF7050|nr:DUF1800 domain-containing protein [Asticcacaulis sp. AND118]UDF05054.1 DUF1800 domain-containing protein [Asticcacaulis sp. AND118]
MAAPLAACGGGGGGGGGSTPSSAPVGAAPATPAPVSISDVEAARFLLQAQFSATDDEIAAVKSQGLSGWLNTQYNGAISTPLWDWLQSNGYNAITTDRYYFSNRPGENGVWNQLISSSDQMRKRIALALSEHFVAPINVSNSWPSAILAGYWDMLNTHAFGNFRQLMEAVTLNVQMGLFLNTAGSRKSNSQGRRPDENYSREIMQLFTLGLVQLNLDGTPKTDSAGRTLDTYTQSDVENLAHVFSGYSFDLTGITETTPAWETVAIRDPAYARKPMAVDVNGHSYVAVTFHGTSIAANTPADVALKTALDTLFNHPNVGPFFATAMIKRLVTSNPSPAYVQRVATAFNDNGSGVRGDLKAVWTAILTDSEARATMTATSGKLREPMIRFIQWARMAEVTSSNGAWNIGDLSQAQNLGQSPLRSASVFNFFRPGYVPPNTEIANRNLVAPEFQIVNESTTAGYLNFMLTSVRSGVQDVKPHYTALLPKASDPAALMAALNLRMTANQLSSNTVSVIQNAIGTLPAGSDSEKLTRIQAAVYLVLASSEYLIQK